jgi:predicted metal-dependent peptidase
MDARTKMTKARAGLVLDRPFFGSLSLRLKLQENPAIYCMRTNGKILQFNPSRIDELSLDQVKGIIAHEVMHVALEHQARFQNRKFRLWNKACDYAINHLLLADRFTLPDDALTRDDLRDLSAEQVYARLLMEEAIENSNNKDQSKPCTGGSGDQDDGQSNTPDNSQDDDDDDQQNDQDTDQNNDDNQNDQDDDQDDEQTDNSNDNQPGSDPDCPSSMGEIEQGDFESHEDLTKHLQDWKVAVAQAAQQERSWGRGVSNCMDHIVEEQITPKVDWKEVLWRFVDQSVKVDYSFAKPNMRYIHSGFMLPSLDGEELGHVVVAVDTSGSVSADELNLFAAEITSILQDLHAECDVVYCDSIVRNTQHFTFEDLPVKFDFRGRGYTDFRPPFKWVEEQGIQPVCLIYLTDMACYDFPDEPPYPTLWVRIGSFDNDPPFGELVEMGDDE